MKKLILSLLIICLLTLTTGCQNNQEQPAPDGSQTDDTPITETSEYKLTELCLEISSDKTFHTLDLVALDTNIYAIIQDTTGSTTITGNDNPYYVVSFNKNGENLTSVKLETPKLNGELCCLKQFTIGQDGKIYALRLDYIDTSSEENTPNFKNGIRLVSWTSDGSLSSDTSLEILNEELYSDAHIQRITISKDGCVSLCCKYLNGGYFISEAKTDGTIESVVEENLNLYSTTHFKRNNDGSLYSIRVDNSRTYYTSYDNNEKKLSEEIVLPKGFDFMTCLPGENQNSIYYFDTTGIQKFDLTDKTTELIIDFQNSNLTKETLLSIIPINETDYICIFDNGSLDAIHRIGFLRIIEE